MSEEVEPGTSEARKAIEVLDAVIESMGGHAARWPATNGHRYQRGPEI